MADLTPDEKQRIYLEEKTRLEAQTSFRSERRSKRLRRWWPAVIALLLGGIWLLPGKHPASPGKMSVPPPTISWLSLHDFQWAASKNGQLFANFSVINSGAQPVKDLVLLCDLFASSGTQLGQLTHTFYEIFDVDQMKEFAGIALGALPAQTEKVWCRFVQAVPMQP